MKLYGTIIDNLNEKGYPKYKPSNGTIEMILHKELGVPLNDDEDKGERVFAMGSHRGYEVVVYQDGKERHLRIPQYVDIKFPPDHYPWAHRALTEKEEEFINEKFLKGLLKNLLKEDIIRAFVIDGGIMITHTCVIGYPTTEEMIAHAEEAIDTLANYWES